MAGLDDFLKVFSSINDTLTFQAFLSEATNVTVCDQRQHNEEIFYIKQNKKANNFAPSSQLILPFTYYKIL